MDANNDVRVLMAKGKRAAAAYIRSVQSAWMWNDTVSQHLNQVLDKLLNPANIISEWETIEWVKWLIAGGRTPDEFANTVRTYDNATTCGLVWTPNFVAYRCRTCGISPCMSLCTECFKKGNHQRHDFNMFLSQAGGACDCGDTSVMKETGFCDRHGPNKSVNKDQAPTDLMCVAQAMMPRIILRLVQHLREHFAGGTEANRNPIHDADAYVTMLLDFNNMGGLMRRVMTTALTNPQQYRLLNEVPDPPVTDYDQYLAESKRIYEEALRSLPNPVPMDEYKDCPSLQEQLVHKTFLEELVFWTVKFEFPQKIVCLLLNMLPDPDYKEALTRAFVLHYSRISKMLEKSRDPDMLSNRVVHVSVQLFSNEGLALRMTEQLNLLHVMVVSLKYMMSKILIENHLHHFCFNDHLVVDCGQSVMKDHCYWPLVSDLNNVLSHRPVAWRFMFDDSLLHMWFTFIGMFQGMNVNHRELTKHVEFEPNTYYAAFSAELEASAYPMWALVSHLVDHNTANLTRRVLSACLAALHKWLYSINYTNPYMDYSLQVSFHLPLHRYLAVFLCQAVAKQGIALNDVLPSSERLSLLMMHPLRVQVAFYEIINGLWVRNGLQIKGQAMTYIQCNFCNSMVDADLYLLQICCTRIPAETFLNIVIAKFHVRGWTSLEDHPHPRDRHVPIEEEQEPAMVESMLTFLATLISVRTNLGLSETGLNRLEMITLLCMSDKTHSQLMELMPERCGTSQSRDFEALLAEVADYRAPALEATGNMQQGMYVPKAAVWQSQYDPIHVLLRAVHRRDFQTSLDRYADYARHANKLKSGTPWPPFRTPSDCSAAYEDPRLILRSRLFHALALVILKKAVDNHNLVNENGMALIVFLLEQAIEITLKTPDNNSMCATASGPLPTELQDMDLSNWFPTDSLFENLRTEIDKVLLKPLPDFAPTAYTSGSHVGSSDSDNSRAGIDDEEPPSPLSEVFMLDEAEWNEPGTSDVAVANDYVVYRLPIDQESSNTDRRLAIPGPSRSSPRPIPQYPALLGPDAPSTSTADEGMMQVALPTALRLELFGSPQATSSPTRMLVPSQAQSEPEEDSPPSTQSPSDNNALVRRNSPRRGAQKMHYKRAGVEAPLPRYCTVNESVISLLLKLHSQLSGEPNSYTPEDAEKRADPEMLGDGTFYIGRLLDKIAAADNACKDYIAETRSRLWPPKEDGEEEAKRKELADREARRRRAKERQQKLMAEFANKQKQFMEATKEDDNSNMDWSSTETPSEPMKQEYDCVICNQSSPSTEKKPMGLVVLVQATSVLGHRRKAPSAERSVLPTCDEERETLSKDDTLLAEFDWRCEEFGRYFQTESWKQSINIGWEGGVYVQTCGHHLHLDCLKSYINSLRSQQRQQILAPDKGEYFCPLCRQLANSVLPLSPQLGDCSQVVRSRPVRMQDVVSELSNFLKENEQTQIVTNLSEAIVKAMEDMTNSTQLKPIFQPRSETTSGLSRFLFVTSVARTNLEIELVQRGGSLVTITQEPPNPLLPKRDCIVPLLHVLAVHARVVAMWPPAWTTFQLLCGVTVEDSSTTEAVSEVPLILKDPIALLIHFVLLLPLHLDQTYFTTVVKMVYNLIYYQIVTQVACGLTYAERSNLKKHALSTNIDSLAAALGVIDLTFSRSTLYMEDDRTFSKSPQVNMVALEQQVQKLCLPFLRIAALLRHHLYNQPLPDIRAPESEFVRLVYYLELVTEGMDWECFNSAVALNWPSDTDAQVQHRTPTIWCTELVAFVRKNHFVAYSLVVEQHITWQPPRLLQLPREYEKIFTYYHERPCLKCHHVPAETSICLLCGTIVCLKQNCCKQQSVCEAVSHSLECGAGTGVFLVVTSTYIIVIRGKRACLWGSLYLDDFEEEDRDLKRGKPLYLSKDRYQLLEQQWLAHRFDHTKKTWVWHRDAL